MIFSSLIFLWLFLPLVLGAYYLIAEKYRNGLLLAASILFYSWGEPVYVALMICTIALNFLFGLWLDKGRVSGARGHKLLLAGCVALNLGLLAHFKYDAFLRQTLDALTGGRGLMAVRSIALPVGISFYTFQALSYVIDVYRGEIRAQRSFLRLALYVSFFPQLVAGPIVRYHDIEAQLARRTVDLEGFYAGVRRFVYGLGKKVLLSNQMAVTADRAFSMPSPGDLTTAEAWVGIIAYAFQIYFDFSGYSDMAIGLGRMFGFHFEENFRYPYLSGSIREFWRRWHISLSTWFREYLYIPLGGNRRGAGRTYLNLLIVFFATGLWHGASWNFVIWGLYHGLFLVLERWSLGRALEKNPVKALNHLYAMGMVLIGWVFFRADSLPYALGYLGRLFAFSGEGKFGLGYFVTPVFALALAAAVLTCGLLQPALKTLPERLRKRFPLGETALLGGGLVLSILSIAAGGYNPFIYFRF